ncbi:hypothetical protein [Flavobacterium limnosediminis]|nr:hypothetical protein [Flavobacterium limnosediminis]
MMNYFFWITLLFFGGNCFSQKKDTITVGVHLKRYVEFAQKDLKARYNYTKSVENLAEYRSYKDTFGCKFISDYKLKELKIKVTPEFELSKDFKFQGNVLDFVDFNPEKINVVYSIYDKTNNFLDYEFESQEWSYFDSALMFNCWLTEPMGSNVLTMMKLRLQDKYFTFRLKNLSQVLFIVDKGLVYAITKPRLDGTYEKTEINEFFGKEIGCGGIEFMMDSDEEWSRKKYEFTPSEKFFKEAYYFNPKIQD